LKGFFFGFFWSIIIDCKFKLSTHGSNSILRFIIELEFYLLMGSFLTTPTPWNFLKFMKQIKDFTFKSEWSHWRWHHVKLGSKIKIEKSENLRFYEQNKLPFWDPALQPLDSFSCVAAYRSFSKIQEKQIYSH
jgi:hypothetical protein